MSEDPDFANWLRENRADIEFKCATDQPVPREDVSEVLFKVPIVKDYVEQGISDHCIKSSEGYIELPKKLDKTQQFDTFELPKKFKLYKGMESFVTPEDEGKFFDKMSGMHPTWLGPPFIAAQFAAQNHGGIHVYQAAKPLKLLVWNSTNVEQLYALLCEFQTKKGGFYNTIKKAFQVSVGIDIPFGLRMKYINYLDNAVGKIQVCQTDKPVGEIYCGKNYTDLKYYFRKYTHHVFIFKYFVFPLIVELKLDGIFVPQHANPVHRWGYWAQEIILLDQPKCLTRLVNDPLDWMFYRKYLDFRVPDSGFLIAKDVSRKNKDYKIMKWYLKMQDAYIPSFRKPANSLVIVNLNVHQFEPIRLGTSVDTITEMANFMKAQSADVAVLHEVLSISLMDLLKAMSIAGFTSHSILENHSSIVFSKTKTTFQLPLQIAKVDAERGIRHKRYATFFTLRGIKMCATHLSIGSYTFKIKDEKRAKEVFDINSAQRISELNIILDQNPDVIIGDLNFQPNDPEFAHLVKKGYTTELKEIKETTPFGTTVDYFFFKKDFKKSYNLQTVPYKYSDHYPVLCTINDFYTGGAGQLIEYSIPDQYRYDGQKFYTGNPQPLYELNDIPGDNDTRLLYTIMSSPDMRITVTFNPPAKIIKKLTLETGHAFRVFHQIATQNSEMSNLDIKSIWPPNQTVLYFTDSDAKGVTTTSFSNTIIVAKLIFNANSLDFLKYQDLDRFLMLSRQCWALMNSYAKFLDMNFTAKEREQTVAYHGLISYMLGLRRFNDIDVLWGGPAADVSKFNQFNYIDIISFDEKFDSAKSQAQLKSVQCRFLRSSDVKTIDQLWNDPNEYGYFMGIKCLKLSTNINLRLMRQRPKAMAELVALKLKYPALVPKLKIPTWKIDEQNLAYMTTTSIMENQFVCFYNKDGELLTEKEILEKRSPVDQSRYLMTLLKYLSKDFRVNITLEELVKFLDQN